MKPTRALLAALLVALAAACTAQSPTAPDVDAQDQASFSTYTTGSGL